jgi:hypothetical protein
VKWCKTQTLQHKELFIKLWQGRSATGVYRQSAQTVNQDDEDTEEDGSQAGNHTGYDDELMEIIDPRLRNVASSRQTQGGLQDIHDDAADDTMYQSATDQRPAKRAKKVKHTAELATKDSGSATPIQIKHSEKKKRAKTKEKRKSDGTQIAEMMGVWADNDAQALEAKRVSSLTEHARAMEDITTRYTEQVEDLSLVNHKNLVRLLKEQDEELPDCTRAAYYFMLRTDKHRDEFFEQLILKVQAAGEKATDKRSADK